MIAHTRGNSVQQHPPERSTVCAQVTVAGATMLRLVAKGASSKAWSMWQPKGLRCTVEKVATAQWQTCGQGAASALTGPMPLRPTALSLRGGQSAAYLLSSMLLSCSLNLAATSSAYSKTCRQRRCHVRSSTEDTPRHGANRTLSAHTPLQSRRTITSVPGQTRHCMCY